MRQLIRTYTITGLHEITITGYTFTKEDVRLIIDETLAITDKRASVLVSSTAKNNIVSVVNGVITLANTTANLTVGDELTIEIDIDNVAKENTVTSSKLEILNKIDNIPQPDLSTVAKQGSNPNTSLTIVDDKIDDFYDTFDADLGDVASVLEYIEQGGLPTITAIAKLGTNTSATLTATQDYASAAASASADASSKAGDLKSWVGIPTSGHTVSSDAQTAATQATNAYTSAEAAKTLIGQPAQGQPSDLFAAIAAGGGGGGSAAVPQISVPDSGSAATQELAANTLYIFPNRTSDLTITLGTPVTGEASEYHFIIEVGSTLPTITLPNGLTWKSSDTIAFDTDTTYEVSILDNYAIFVVW